MKERITVGGSAANPPHLGHKALIECLLRCGKFGKVIWIPSGVRKDKKDLILSDHRVVMTVLTFPKEWFYGLTTEFLISFKEVYDISRPTSFWLKQIQEEYINAEVSWYTGVDSVVPQDRFDGRCEIERIWFNGPRLMQECRFYILPRNGERYPHPSGLSLPPQFGVIDGDLPDISSTDIVRKISKGEKFEHLVVPEVAEYIKRHRLYGWKGD